MFEWIVDVVQRMGYSGVLVLTLLENVFPPIPSELVMPLAGFVAARGHLDLGLVILAGVIGSVAGAVFWYMVGRRLGTKRLKWLAGRYGRWLTIEPADIDRANAWFIRHGALAVLIARLVPGVRTFVSIPAGIARMKFLPFLLYTTIGTALWTTVLTGAGYVLQSQYVVVAHLLDPISVVVVVAFAGWYAWRLLTWAPRAAE